MPIRFFSESIQFKPNHPRKISSWITSAIISEKKVTGEINYIFCSDDYLLEMNIQYLNHKTLTDIITFPSSDDPSIISGDIFISIERVQENAGKFGTSFEMELHRVMIHGVLHLIGYSDKSEAQKKLMRKKEDAYLSLRTF